MADTTEIYIGMYFANMNSGQEAYSGLEWERVNAIRDKINSFEYEDDIYRWLYQRRLNAANRSEDLRLFNIPLDAVVTLNMHGRAKNRYHGWYSDDYDGRYEAEGGGKPKDYCKRDRNGKLKLNRKGEVKRYGKVSRGLINFSDNVKSSKLGRIIRFMVMHPLTSLIIVLIPIVSALLIIVGVWVAGTLGSFGHTPFVLCGDGEIREGVYVNVDENAEVDQMATTEYAIQAFVYTTGQLNWKSNAVIGTIAYILQEGGGMGTFTYESYFSVVGPGGQERDKTLNNEAWLNWMEQSGKYQLHGTYYHNPAYGSTHQCFLGDGKLYSAIGIGLLQDSNVWHYNLVWVVDNEETGDGHWEERPYLAVDNANRLIQWCEERGKPWQDPLTQIEWVIHRLDQPGAFDDEVYDVNPVTDNRTAEEWCRRVCTGIGMPAWKHDTTNPYQNKVINDHVRHLDRARELYNKYSNQDLNIGSLSGQMKDQCEGLKNIFNGSNATIAQAAVALASGDIHAGDTQIPWDMDGSSSPNLNRSELSVYKIVHETIFPGDVYFASCDRSVACAVRWAGADDTFPAGATGTQWSYLRNSPKWDYIGVYGQCMVMPGDVLITQGSGHIKLYVGMEAAQSRNHETQSYMYQGSFHDYFPRLGQDPPDGTLFEVYRCTNPDNSNKYKNAHEGIINN